VNTEGRFFSDGYIAARARFREAAESAQAELLSLPVRGTAGPLSGGEDLTIDIAIVRSDAASAARKSATAGAAPASEALDVLLVHLSGVHGVEAHVGSAIQIAFLDAWRKGEYDTIRRIADKRVAVAVVHTVNPFGFLHGVYCTALQLLSLIMFFCRSCNPVVCPFPVGRRWNENNIDLNRNFLPEDTFPGKQAALVEAQTQSDKVRLAVV
jgi:hypothetical protein